jgi:hypothetical protein
MPAYVLPQVLVFQEFAIVPAVVARPLRAHVAGGHAQLIRFDQPAERNDGLLGFYDDLVDTSYLFPARPAGGVPDASYTKVWMQDALLPYFSTQAGQGDDITKVANYNNRVHAVINFVANGTTWPRNAAFLDRDVQPGDIVKIRGVDTSSQVQTVWSFVKSIIGDPVAATVGTASADASNSPTQAASTSHVKVGGAANAMIIAAVDGTLYDGTADGFVTETYDVLVTGGSVNENDTVAQLRVISGSGTDDQASVTPAQRGTPFAIGTRGLKITFGADDLLSSSQSASIAGVPPTDLVPGQRWRITVSQTFAAPAATSGGTYLGVTNTTYVIEVFRGGHYTAANKPMISVTTTTGSDISGPTPVPAAGTPVAVGTQGVTVSFDQTALCKGDRYYVAVSAEAIGAMRVLELGTGMPSTIAAGTELDLSLYILKSELQIPQNRLGFAPLVNWEQSDTEITLKAGIIAYDASWTSGGVPVALDVVSEASQDYGLVYVETRYWLSELCFTVGSVSSSDLLDEAIPGPLDPDNPLKWGVSQALMNSNGVDVKFTAVCNPDLDEDWAAVLELLVGRDDVYNLVPLTTRRTVLDLYALHVDNQSAPEIALWRAAWFSLTGMPEIPVVFDGTDGVPNHVLPTTSDGQVCLCTVTDDPLTSGIQYTIVHCPSGNSKFLTNGVRPGDVVRTQYTGDGFGDYTYSEYVVDEVTAEDELRLLSGPNVPISVASKTEVWRNLSADDEAAEIAQDAGSWGDRRIRAVWPDVIGSGGILQNGYHLCAALAGLASGVLPHQGLTHVQIAGFSDVSRTTNKFSRTQLDVMAGGGVWIVTQDPLSFLVYTRHAVTTGPYDDINQREEMITRNVDSISYRFKEQFAPFIGVTNVTEGVIVRVGTEAQSMINLLKTESATDNLGGQLIEGTIVDLRRHLTLLDRIVITIQLVVPYALNNIEIHLSI